MKKLLSAIIFTMLGNYTAVYAVELNWNTVQSCNRHHLPAGNALEMAQWAFDEYKYPEEEDNHLAFCYRLCGQAVASGNAVAGELKGCMECCRSGAIQ